MPHKAFITNTQTKTLKKRLAELIEHSAELKFLAGFFYFSGWGEIYDSLKGRNDIEIKVLVGLDVDKKLFSMLEFAEPDGSLSAEDKADKFFKSLRIALNSEELDIPEFYNQIEYFIQLVEANRLKIKKTKEPNHAKLYIFKIKDALKGILPCKFITGSSNLTRAGISEQNEFNVEIGDYGTDKAEEYFDQLWKDAIPITEDTQRKKDLLDLIKNRTQAADVTPFEAYIKVLKTYIDLQKQKQIKPHVQRLLEKRGYKNYNYQSDAVTQALTIIENYNGVIIADVVGLGKSVIASMVAKNLGKRGIIICPPGLVGDKQSKSGWRMYTEHFGLYDWEVSSGGDLQGIQGYIEEHGDDIEIVIIDEAHRYRNQDTQSYELLNAICRNRQVMLLTATPFSNSPADIFSLLKLFIIPGKSKITLDENLEARFNNYERVFRELSFISKNYNSEEEGKRVKAEDYYEKMFDSLPIDISIVNGRTKELAAEIREVLEPIMIRRNRLDLKKDPVYCKEVTQLSEVDEPCELFFELSKEQSEFYDNVINDYFGETGQFTGAIYQPFKYEIKSDKQKLDEEGNRTFQQQRNLSEFMRRLVVKRFESSFGAFAKTIDNFIVIHNMVKQFIKDSNGKYVLDRKIIEDAYGEDEDIIEEMLEKFRKSLEDKKVPKHEKVYDINTFQSKDDFLRNIDLDLELLKKIQTRVAALKLVENDPKSLRLVDEINKVISKNPLPTEPKRKVIIFTEYVDTVNHLAPVLEKLYQDKLLVIAGSIGTHQHELLLANFDASKKPKAQEDQYQVLLTSDKLSEGFNLNRAGAIINYDIPWNPTRVIQRVGRINRIGKKVFERLQIYNFFPTEQGADVVKSRLIAGQKMFLIHNTLGEDCKIFDVDETPSPAELYKRVNTNPEDYDEESLLTKIRSEYFRLEKEHPEIIARIDKLPNRIKTAKKYSGHNLVVFRRKALGLFIHNAFYDEQNMPDVKDISIETALNFIKCDYSEPRLERSEKFWAFYEEIKKYRQKFPVARNEISLEVKAQNNLQSAIRCFKTELDEYLPFIRDLIKDLRDYHTIPKYSLRRIANIDFEKQAAKGVEKFISEMQYLQRTLGKDYFEVVEKRVKDNKDEIIIAVENQNYGNN